jgi:hypothetical protein
VVVYTCPPKICRRLRSGGSQFEVFQGKKSFQDPISTEKNLSLVVHACHPRYCGKHKIQKSRFRPAWVKSKTLSPKQQKQKG